MEFRVNRKELSEALAIAQSCVETKGTIPILAFALMESKGGKVEITATDLDLTLTTRLEAEGDEFDVCVPARQLAQLVALFQGETVTFTKKENTGRVEVSCGKSKYMLPSAASENYPDIPKVTGEEFPMKGSMLKTMLERTLFAVGEESSRYAMQGVFLETKGGKLFAVGTDGFRLAQIKYSVPFSGSVSANVPRRAVQAILKAINVDDPVTLRFGENSIYLSQGLTAITARTIVGRFPAHETFIPKEGEHSFTLSASDVTAFKRSALTAYVGGANKSPEIFFDVSKTGIAITSGDREKGEGSDYIDRGCPTLNGDSVKLGVAARQVVEMLAHEPEIAWSFSDNKTPFRLTPTGLREYEYVYVMVPVDVK